MAEHSAVNRRVVGSSPTRGVFYLVEIVSTFFVFVFLDSSMAEHCGEFPRYRWKDEQPKSKAVEELPAVNRRVAGSGNLFM